LCRVIHRDEPAQIVLREKICKGAFMLKALRVWVADFCRREDGPTSTEYAINLALIALFCISTVQSMGENANKSFKTVSAKLGSASS